MNKFAIFFVFLSFVNIVHAEDQLSGFYYKSYKEPGRNELFSSEMQIQRLSKNQAAVSVAITAPTAGSSCGGSIKGIAKVRDTQLTLEDTDGDNKCTLTIEVINKVASVITTNGCSGWSGAGCSLGESAINLPWAHRANPSFKRDALKRAP